MQTPPCHNLGMVLKPGLVVDVWLYLVPFLPSLSVCRASVIACSQNGRHTGVQRDLPGG